MTKEIKHNCPTGQKFHILKGKCVNKSEFTESVDDDSDSRDKSARNLKFPKRLGGKRLGIT